MLSPTLDRQLLELLRPPVEAPEACARCGHDRLDDDHYCLLCGAVTLDADRFVAAYGPDE